MPPKKRRKKQAKAKDALSAWGMSTEENVGPHAEGSEELLRELVREGLRCASYAEALKDVAGARGMLEEIFVQHKACVEWRDGGDRGSAYWTSGFLHDRSFGILMKNDIMRNMIESLMETYREEKGWDEKVLITRAWLQKAATQQEIANLVPQEKAKKLKAGKHKVHGDSLDPSSTARLSLSVGESPDSSGKWMGWIKTDNDDVVKIPLAHGSLVVMEEIVAGAESKYPQYRHWVEGAGGTFLIVFEFGRGGGNKSVIFSNVALMGWVLDKVVTRDLLRKTLLQLYPCAENPDEIVDDELIDSFYVPAKQAGSKSVLSQILTNDAGLTPMEVHAKHSTFLNKLPIHVVWGNADTVTPVDGIGEVGQLYGALASEENNRVTMEVMNGGHILFDEVPDANRSMIRWLNDEVVRKKQNDG